MLAPARGFTAVAYMRIDKFLEKSGYNNKRYREIRSKLNNLLDKEEIYCFPTEHREIDTELQTNI